MLMLTELCQILRNWFDRDQKKWYGKITISDGNVSFIPDPNRPQEAFSLQTNQYFRVIGSLFNDGVHKYPDEELVDESFTGAIWAMAVPPAVIALADEIQAWKDKYGGVDGAAMSPYASESFGGYSYTKGSRSSAYGSGGGGSSTLTWQDMFASRLNAWRKI